MFSYCLVFHNFVIVCNMLFCSKILACLSSSLNKVCVWMYTPLYIHLYIHSIEKLLLLKGINHEQ